MKTLFMVLILMVMTSSTSATRSIEVNVEEGGHFIIGSFENLVEVKKGDESLSNTPDISPTLSVPLQ